MNSRPTGARSPAQPEANPSPIDEGCRAGQPDSFQPLLIRHEALEAPRGSIEQLNAAEAEFDRAMGNPADL